MNNNQKSQEKNQTIFKIEKRHNPYAMIDTRVAEDQRLSWKAKGLMLYLLSRPDNWEIRRADLIKRSSDGIDAVKSTIKELTKYGYIKLDSLRDKQGKIVKWIYTVFEEPHPEAEIPLVDNHPEVDFPQVENPLVENPPPNNNNIYNNININNNHRRQKDNTKKQNTNKITKNNLDDDDLFNLLLKFGLPKNKISQIIKIYPKNEIEYKCEKIKLQIASQNIKNIPAYTISVFENNENSTIEDEIKTEIAQKRRLNEQISKEKQKIISEVEKEQEMRIQAEYEEKQKIINSASPQMIKNFEKTIKQNKLYWTMYLKNKFESLIIQSLFMEFYQKQQKE
ncbi:MAG: helix-turn-helix domain-containing protein [Endomicrobiaceae bacterium]